MRFYPDLGGATPAESRLRRFKLSLGTGQAGGFNPTYAVVLGDSITELSSFRGVGRNLANIFNLATAPPAGWGSTTVAAAVPVWAGPGTRLPLDPRTTLRRGRAGYAYTIQAGETVSITRDCAGFSFNWISGTVEIRVGGVLVHTGASGNYFHAPAGNYLVEVTATGGPAMLDGAHFFAASPLLGAHWIEWGHSGYTTRDVLDTPETWTALAAQAPKLVVLATGINDDQVTAYPKDMAELIARTQATAPDASVALWVPHESITNLPGSLIQSHARRLADRFGCHLIDWYAATGPGAYLLPSFSADGTHLTAGASAWAAQHMWSSLAGDFMSTARAIP